MPSRLVAWSGSAILFAVLYVGIPWTGLQIDGALGLPRLPPWLQVPGIVLTAFGVAGLGWCFALFSVRGGGTANPVLPPERLVTTGPYAWTRNPIILFHAATLLGLSWFFGSPMTMAITLLLGVPAHVIVLHEERTLEARFGTEYVAYKASVPRWIGRPRRQS